MGKNKVIILVLTILIFGSIIGATAYKVYKGHLDREFEVLEKEITESTKKCYLDKKCTGDSTTIGNLRTFGYINDELVNPQTKEVIGDDKVITNNNGNYQIDLRS